MQNNRLDSIAKHQRKSRVLDAAFATLLVIAGAVSIGSVRAGARAANDTQVAHVGHR